MTGGTLNIKLYRFEKMQLAESLTFPEGCTTRECAGVHSEESNGIFYLFFLLACLLFSTGSALLLMFYLNAVIKQLCLPERTHLASHSGLTNIWRCPTKMQAPES